MSAIVKFVKETYGKEARPSTPFHAYAPLTAFLC